MGGLERHPYPPDSQQPTGFAVTVGPAEIEEQIAVRLYPHRSAHLAIADWHRARSVWRGRIEDHVAIIQSLWSFDLRGGGGGKRCRPWRDQDSCDKAALDGQKRTRHQAAKRVTNDGLTIARWNGISRLRRTDKGNSSSQVHWLHFASSGAENPGPVVEDPPSTATSSR